MIREAMAKRDDRQGRHVVSAGRKDRTACDIEVGYAVHTAIGIDDTLFAICRHSCGAHMVPDPARGFAEFFSHSFAARVIGRTIQAQTRETGHYDPAILIKSFALQAAEPPIEPYACDPEAVTTSV